MGVKDRVGPRSANAAGLAIGLALLCAGSVQGASARFSRLSVQDGLSQSSVETIAEDRYGFLWFGTQEGLNRFDGHRFIVHQQGPGAGRLRDAFIRAIVPDSAGDLWIGTESGLQHLDVATGRFEESVAPAGIGVRLNGLCITRGGRVWFAGLTGGLWTVPPPAAGATRAAVSVLAPSVSIRATAVGSDGTLWAADEDNLLSLRIAERSSAVSVASEKRLQGIGPVRLIHVDPAGILWIGRQGRPLMRFDPRSGEVTEYGALPHFVLTIASAGGGRLWIGGRDAGLTLFDPATGRMETYRHEPGNEESLAENDVAVVHPDGRGNLWVGAWNGGLSRLNLFARAFHTLRSNADERHPLPGDVTKMGEGPDGRLWVLTRNEILAAGDPLTGRFDPVAVEGDLTAMAFSGPTLFVGTTTGLLELDPASDRMLPPRPALRAAGLDRIRIDALEGGQAHLWAVADGMLFRVPSNESTGDVIQRVALPVRGEPTSMHSVSPDRLWISFAEGVLLLVERSETGGLKVSRRGDGSQASRGRLIAAVEHRGSLWIGTARGIGRLDRSTGVVSWVDPEQGMPSRSVAAIVADDSGMLWIPTNLGITRFDPATGRAVHFGAVQGAQGSGYVDGGAVRGPSGRIYFAGRGITVLDPSRVRENPNRPRIVFTELEILHRPVRPRWIDPDSPLMTSLHAAEEIVLDSDAVVFSVEMASPGTSDPESVRFLHRLEGFDEEWIETTAERRVATYTRLEPGTYVLRASARTAEGLASAEEARLTIRVLPPWWLSPMAIAGWCLLAALLVAAAVAEARRRTRVRIALAEQDALRRASVTDPLTGLYNRRFLAAWLKHELPRALRNHGASNGTGRSGESLLFVVVDLDNLKEINDRFGHDAGDRAIVAVAALLQSYARADDLAVRWGGDEYVLLLRSIDREQAPAIVERLRAAAERMDLGFDPPRCTISLGYASYPFLEDEPGALTWEQTLQLADHALLISKRNGRNAWAGLIASVRTSSRDVSALLGAGTDASAMEGITIVHGPQGQRTSES